MKSTAFVPCNDSASTLRDGADRTAAHHNRVFQTSGATHAQGDLHARTLTSEIALEKDAVCEKAFSQKRHGETGLNRRAKRGHQADGHVVKTSAEV